MPAFTYLIIGGGMAADAAVKGIRQIQAEETIGMLSSENVMPYNRPPLSKGLWKGDSVESVMRKTPYEHVEVFLSRTAAAIDPQRKTVTDDRGAVYAYDKLLLATGGSVKRLPFTTEGIIYYRTLADYDMLRARCADGKKFVVIGGGFIGSEIAAALAMNGKSVTMLFPGDAIGSHVYPPRLSHFLNTYYRSKGVEIFPRDTAVSIDRMGGSFRIMTSGGKTLDVDGIVAGIGIVPNTELASAAGLDVKNGIVVNEFLCTSHPGIYAAGDAVNFYNPLLGKRIRVEHEDNALSMGETAGINMTGIGMSYRHLPFFYSDMFDLGYEAIGELDASSEIVEDWKEEFKEGILYYVRDARVRGVLLWNRWGLVDEARRLIAEKGPIQGKDLRGRL